MVNYKKHIRSFDFAHPDFSWLPKNPEKINRKGLSKMEGQILDGIIYQHKVSQYLEPTLADLANGFYKLSLSTAAFGVISLLLIMVTYYLNVKYNLGITFLTEVFS